MDDKGYLRRVTRGIDDLASEREVLVPQEIVEAVANMTRAERRRQWRLLHKAEKRAAKNIARRLGQ